LLLALFVVAVVCYRRRNLQASPVAVASPDGAQQHEYGRFVLENYSETSLANEENDK